jgi:hypothetical protein
MHFDGQGGMAGFGKGSAQVKLSKGNGGTLLEYAAKAQVGGKLAQVGSRLVDAAAGKITNDFFAAFNARVGADAAAAGEVLEVVAEAPAAAGAVVARPAAAATEGSGWPAWVWWLVGGLTAAGLLKAIIG